MPKCDFNKVVLQLHLNYTLAWLHSFRAPFYKNTSDGMLLGFFFVLHHIFENAIGWWTTS